MFHRGQSQGQSSSGQAKKNTNDMGAYHILYFTMDQDETVCKDIFDNMTIPVSDAMREKVKRKKCQIAYASLSGDNPTSKNIKWDAKEMPINVNELVICAHGEYFNDDKYEAAIEKGKVDDWAGTVAGHVRKITEPRNNKYVDRHIGEYRFDQVATLITDIMIQYPALHTVKFYVCETGQTFKFPGNFITMETIYEEDAYKGMPRKITKFVDDEIVTRISQKEKQIELTQSLAKSISQVYAGNYAYKKLTNEERDDYLAAYSNAEIILALVDEKLTKLEKLDKQILHNHLIIFKAPTGMMDVRKADPKYRAFDRRYYDEVAANNDAIADNRDAVPAVRFVMNR